MVREGHQGDTQSKQAPGDSIAIDPHLAPGDLWVADSGETGGQVDATGVRQQRERILAGQQRMKVRPVTADVDDHGQDKVGRGVEAETRESASFVAHKMAAWRILDLVGDPPLPHRRRVDERVVDRDVIDDDWVSERGLVEIPSGRRLPVMEL